METCSRPPTPRAAPAGVKIVFSGSDGRRQTLYYFRTDLSNRGVQSSGFLQFCAQFGIGDVFIKAASYLLHNAGFSTVRDFLLGHGASIVQDDTGIPVKYFQQAGWELRAVRPVCGADPGLQRQLSIEAQGPVRESRRSADRLRHRLSMAHQSIACAVGREQGQPGHFRQSVDHTARPQSGGEKCCADTCGRAGSAVRRLALDSPGWTDNGRPCRAARAAGSGQHARLRAANDGDRRRRVAGIGLLAKPKRPADSGGHRKFTATEPSAFLTPANPFNFRQPVRTQTWLSA